MTTVVSLLPTAAHDRLVKMLAEQASGSFTVHVQQGEIRSFEVRETASVPRGKGWELAGDTGGSRNP